MDIYLVTTYFFFLLSVVLLFMVYRLSKKVNKRTSQLGVDPTDVLSCIKNSISLSTARSEVISKYRHDVNGSLQIVAFGSSMLKRALPSSEDDKVSSLLKQIDGAILKVGTLSKSAKLSELEVTTSNVSIASIIKNTLAQSENSSNFNLLFDEDINLCIDSHFEYYFTTLLQIIIVDLVDSTQSSSRININLKKKDEAFILELDTRLNPQSIKSLKTKYLKISSDLLVLGLNIDFEDCVLRVYL